MSLLAYMSVKTKALSEKITQVAAAQPVKISEDAALPDALSALRAAQSSCVLVCRGRKLSGIFTERDFLMKAAGRDVAKQRVADFMTPDPVCVRMDQTVGEAVEAMNARGIRQLPVVDDHCVPQALVTVDAVIQYLAENFPAAVVNRPPEPHLKAAETDGA